MTVQDHNGRDPGEHVRRFAALRVLNLEQYEAISDEELLVVRPRNEGEAVTLEYVVGRHAGHDLRHLDQIGRYVDAALTARPTPREA